MPMSDPHRIAADRSSPRIVALWQALCALRSTVSFMNTGAHPDDEASAMLAAMRFRDGIDISYACSTRGEGGQNDIGTESAAALGVLRTAEMEAACDVLDLRMYWLSTTPKDTIFDFGFSKSGQETLAKWDHARTLARFVDILRLEKPDIICPTFLDVPGQHGHHRAMTEAAHDVMDLAADPGFQGSDLPPWQVKKLYLPAWSGAGHAYDDDLPPPPATLTVIGSDRDPVTGWSFERIGQQSRVKHATQAMGRWVRTGEERDFPLHLVRSLVDGPDTELASGLAQTLDDLDLPGASDVQRACDAAIAAFPDMQQVFGHASDALRSLRAMTQGCSAPTLEYIGHKLTRKDQQLSRVIHLAAGGEAFAELGAEILHPGDTTVWTQQSSAQIGEISVQPNLPKGWTLDGATIALGADAALSDPYPAIYLPGVPDAPCVDVALVLNDLTVTVSRSFDVPPVVCPAQSAALSPTGDVINLASGRRDIVVALKSKSPGAGAPGMVVPDGWSVDSTDDQFTVRVPQNARPGLYDVTLTLDGAPARSVRHITRDHIAPRALIHPAAVQIRVVDAALPDVRVGYIGGGHDRVCDWLGRMGVNVTDLSKAALSDAELAGCDTLVIGIFAMKFRPGLAEAMARIHDWVRAGGTLVTLYHRPWDNWDPATTAPYRLEIGQPSLRWRVTDEAADVQVLVPDHPILNTPNHIQPADWDDWDKERGLYFAKDWADEYTALLAMKDAGEDPLTGALLVADMGAGRHIHTSLILHHQMERLTQGAFRLMANFLAKRE